MDDVGSGMATKLYGLTVNALLFSRRSATLLR